MSAWCRVQNAFGAVVLLLLVVGFAESKFNQRPDHATDEQGTSKDHKASKKAEISIFHSNHARDSLNRRRRNEDVGSEVHQRRKHQDSVLYLSEAVARDQQRPLGGIVVKDRLISSSTAASSNNKNHIRVEKAGRRRRQKKKHIKHLRLRFSDLKPWGGDKSKRKKKKAQEKKKTRKELSGLNSLRRSGKSNPEQSQHLLAQSYSYPSSFGLSQTDREYFRTVRTENGFTQFLKKNVIKGVQLKRVEINQDGNREEEDKKEEKKKKKNSANESHSLDERRKQPETTTTTTASPTSTAPSTTTRRHHLFQPSLPKFLYHRVAAHELSGARVRERQRGVAAVSLARTV